MTKQTETCTRCEGSGWEPWELGVYCYDCNGAGTVEVEEKRPELDWNGVEVDA